jgi:putative drug exporter of the RND superfamily
VDDKRTLGAVAVGTNRVLVALRHVVILGWVAAAIAAVVYLPSLGGAGNLDLPLPDDAAPLTAEERATEAFGYPLLARTQVIVRDPDGISTQDHVALGEFAVRVTRGEVEGLDDVAAIPVSNSIGLAPGAREDGTAVLTYLLIAGAPTIPRQVTIAERYADAAPVPEGARVGITGSSPSRDQQLATIQERLPIVVGLTLALISIVVALVLRSLVAPLIVLAVVGVAWVILMRLLGWVGETIGLSAGQDLEPIVSALLIGVVTDYSIFYLFGMRERLREEGTDASGRKAAAVSAGAHYIAIVITAGVTTALGTAALFAGRLDFFRAFAPALALTAIVAVVVSITLLPALLALLGRTAFWPGTVGESDGAAAEAEDGASREPRAPLGARLLSTRGVAAVTALVVVAGLGAATWQLKDLRLGLGLDSGIAREAEEVDAAFGPGYRAPTEVLIEGPEATNADALRRVGEMLRARPDVGGVIGPGDPAAAALDDAFVASDIEAARFLLLFDEIPTEHQAIGALDDLQDAVPQMLRAAGMPSASVSFAGDTAIAQAAVDAIGPELLRVGLVALAVNLLLLIVFLRAIGAPLYLLAANVLSMGASLGLAVLVFQDWLDHGQLVYYVPFAAAVLLLALGSDYNIYLMGHIWREARAHGLNEAVRRAIPVGSRPIAVAGIVLAGSFGLLVLVPVDAMRQFAFVMGVGALLDAFIVRTLLVPSLVTVFGNAGYWPRRPPVPEAATGQERPMPGAAEPEDSRRSVDRSGRS